MMEVFTPQELANATNQKSPTLSQSCLLTVEQQTSFFTLEVGLHGSVIYNDFQFFASKIKLQYPWGNQLRI